MLFARTQWVLVIILCCFAILGIVIGAAGETVATAASLGASDLTNSSAVASPRSFGPTESGASAAGLNTPLPNVAQQDVELELVGHLGGSATAVFVQDSYAYVGFGMELAVLDVSDPASPTRVGYVVLPSWIKDLSVLGNYAYVSTSAGLYVVSISDLTKPTQVGFSETFKDLYGITVADGRAYAADNDGFRIFDVSDPASPVEVAAVALSGDVFNVTVVEDYAYVVGGDLVRRLWIFDVSNPVTPVQAGFYDYSSLEFNLWDVAVVDDFAYVSYQVYLTPPSDNVQGLRVIDISDRANPVDVGGTTRPLSDHSGSLAPDFNLAVRGNYAYIATQDEGLWMVDISNSDIPVGVGFLELSEDISSLAVAGNIAYLTIRGKGVRVIDIINPTTPIELVFYDTVGLAYDVAIVDHYAYIADWYWRLWVVDLSDPTDPTPVSSFDLPGRALKIAVEGQCAYIITEQAAGQHQPSHYLRIVNISDAATPVEVGYYDVPGQVSNIAVEDQYVYLTVSGALLIVDVSDPAVPFEAGSYTPTEGYLTSMALTSPYVYAISYYGLHIINISDPSNPSETILFENTIDPFWGGWPIAISGNYAYVTSLPKTLRILDISNPAIPVEVGFYHKGGLVDTLSVANGYTYFSFGLGSNDLRLYIVDVSDPTDPVEVGSHKSLDKQPRNIKAANGYLYGTLNGLGVYRQHKLYSISGQITDVNDMPYPDITVAASSDLTTTTSARGTYTFTHFLTGTYVLTPTLTGSGYSFWPPTRTVTLPPDAYNQDFTILPAPVSTTLILGSGTTSLPATLTFTDTQNLPTRFGFPAGAVTQPTTLVVQPTLATGESGFAFTGHAFALTAYREGSAQLDFVFDTPVTVTISYSEADVRVVSNEQELALWWWTGDEWQDAALTCAGSSYIRDTENNLFGVAICRSGRFALFGPTHPLYLPLIAVERP